MLSTGVACQGFLPTILERARSPWNDIWPDPFHILEENPLSALSGDIDQVSLARVDWKETPESHIIKIDVPGIKKEDIKIEFKSGVLTVSGEQQVEKTDKSEHWHRAERVVGKFIRQFRLTDGDMEGIKASLENGVLVVNVPKVDKKRGEVKVISIESGDGNRKNDEL
eukprot:PITA_35510